MDLFSFNPIDTNNTLEPIGWGHQASAKLISPMEEYRYSEDFKARNEVDMNEYTRLKLGAQHLNRKLRALLSTPKLAPNKDLNNYKVKIMSEVLKQLGYLGESMRSVLPHSLTDLDSALQSFYTTSLTAIMRLAESLANTLKANIDAVSGKPKHWEKPNSNVQLTQP
jgi:hypothetical protein